LCANRLFAIIARPTLLGRLGWAGSGHGQRDRQSRRYPKGVFGQSSVGFGEIRAFEEHEGPRGRLLSGEASR